MIEHFEGRVLTKQFEDPATAFYILRMSTSPNLPPIVVKGYIPGLHIKVGTWFAFEAKHAYHEKFGAQLDITRAPILPNNTWTMENAVKALAGQGVAESILNVLKSSVSPDEFLDLLDNEEELHTILGPFAGNTVLHTWENIRALYQGLRFLNESGIPPGKVRKVWEVFGDESETVLTKNPWRLVEVEGFTFEQADEIASRFNLKKDHPARTSGAIKYSMKTLSTFGHLYLSSGLIYNEAVRLTGNPDKGLFTQCLAHLHKEGVVVLDKKTRPGTLAIYEPWAHHVENVSAINLAKRLKSAAFEEGSGQTKLYMDKLGNVGPITQQAVGGTSLEDVATVAVGEWSNQSSVALSAAQKEGVINALIHPVSILTGLPGTGKTTSLRAAVKILQDAEIPFLLCAPTGIAAKRLSHMAGATASTIHRAFEAKGMDEEERETTYAGIVGSTTEKKQGETIGGQYEDWGFSPDNPHPAKVVIVDEASMVDQHHLYRILHSTAQDCRLVFVGDHAQLPSVGAGNVLKEMIQTKLFPTVKLTEIFRQGDTSGIVLAAHAIHRGEAPENLGSDPDFVLVNERTEEGVRQKIIELAEDLKEGQGSFQVLSPRHGGNVGVTSLNESLRARLNPGGAGIREVRFGKDVIREGDRIMVIKNDYKLNVFNGDVGKVHSIDQRAKQIHLIIYGEPNLSISIDFQDVGRLIRLAYACTVHKAQGLEYDTIILPVVKGFYYQLKRNLYYTGITRAKHKVFLVGTADALMQAIHNVDEDDRNTLFGDRILLNLPD